MKKLILSILLITLLAITFACTSNNKGNRSTFPPITTKPTVEPTPKVSQTPMGISTLTPLPTTDPNSKEGKQASRKMEPVLISLAYASQFHNYSKDNADFIWCATAYLASNYGYGVIDIENPNPTLTLTESQVQEIFNAFFGDRQVSVKNIKLSTEYFTVQNNSYTCVKVFENDSVFKIEKIKVKGKDHIVSLLETNANGKRLSSATFVLQAFERDCAYPQYITEMQYNILGRR